MKKTTLKSALLLTDYSINLAAIALKLVVKLILLVLLLAFAKPSSIFSQTNTFTGPSGGSWNTNTNWNLGHIPTVSEDVVITATGNLTVNFSGTGACKSLTVSMTGNDNTNNLNVQLNINSGTLTVDNDISIINTSTRPARAKYATINVAGNLSCSGGLSMTGSNVDNNKPARLLINNTGSLNIGNALNAGTFLSPSVITVSGSGYIGLEGNLDEGNSSFTAGNGTIEYNGISNQNIGALNYYNLSVSGSNDKSLQASTTVANSLNINGSNLLLNGSDLAVNSNINLVSGNIVLGNNSLTLAGSISGGSASSFINTDGSGYFVKTGNAAAVRVLYPVGSGGYYTPFDVSSGFAATGTGNLRIRTVSSVLPENYIAKYWDVLTTGFTGIIANAVFTYNQAEVQGDESSYAAMYNAGVAWQVASGSGSINATSNTITVTGSDLANGYYSAGSSSTLYSFQSGSWNNPATWTSDPGGTTQTGSSVPGISDRVIILSGRTVTLPADITTANLDVTINEGGFLDLADFSFTNGLDALKGQGTFKLASANFPAIISNSFVNAGGGTVEYNNSSNFILLSTQNTYNNLTINLNTNSIVATQLNNLTINGNLYIKKGVYTINDNSAARRALTIKGNVIVDNVGSISVGAGVTNTVTDPSGITGGTAPYLNYYDSHSHRIELYGDFINNGAVRFTNLPYPVYNAFPPTSVGATTGFATVYFLGATNNVLNCNGTTDFYNLVLDKGVDQSFKLTVYSTAYNNFRIFGANNSTGEGSGTNPSVKKALWIRTGTLVLQGLTVIPSLTEGTVATDPGSNYIIPGNAALLLDGTDVIVQTTADNYREVNAAYSVACPSDAAAGINQNINNSFTIIGRLEVNNGYLTTKESAGFVTSNSSAGQFQLNGGTVDTKQFLAAGPVSGLNAYIQTGGNLVLRGRFQRTPATFATAEDLLNAPINTSRANMTFLDGTKGALSLNNTGNIFSVSGGNIYIYDVTSALNGRAVDVLSSSANINVTGGTVHIIPTTGTNDADATNFNISSTAPFGNLLINRVSSAANVRLITYPVRILKNVTLQSGVFNSNNLNISIGGDFTIMNTATYNAGTNKTIFNGSGTQTFSINTATVPSLYKMQADKTSTDILTLSGTQSIVNVTDSLIISGGMLNDNGKTINVTGHIQNSGTHYGTGKIVLLSENPQFISGGGSGIFQNLELRKPTVGTTVVTASAGFTINGVLTFSGSGNKRLNIQGNNLSLGELATISGADANKYIQTNGQVGDGGLTKLYSSGAPSFVFPVGAPSVRHVGVPYYTPATITINGSPASYGEITVVPVGIEHSNTTVKNRSLTYYWRVKTGAGMNLGAATVSHIFNYSANDVVVGAGITEAEYVPARYNQSTYTWTKGTSASINTATHSMGAPWLANTSIIAGDFTAGDDNPTNPFGAPTKYYSRISGASAGSGLWSNAATWSLISHTGPAAGSVPGASDIVIIGGKDSVYLATNNTVINTGPRSCASLQIEKGSALDIGYNPASTFGMVINHVNGNGNFRLTTSWNTGSTFTFPVGDFSDFNVNLGTTELYSTNPAAGTTYWLPNGITSYGNLILSPLGGSNIIFPNNNLTIYGNLITRGQNADSWFCPTWDTNYPTAPTVRVAKTITINGNMDIQGGGLVWYGNGAINQNIVVFGDVKVAPQACIDVWGGATSQNMSIGGSLINNTTNTSVVSTPSRCDFSLLPVTFFGNSSSAITNTGTTPATGSTPLTIFDKVIVNKGNTQANNLTVNIGGTLTMPNDNWLTLQNGTLQYVRTGDFTVSRATAFSIPASAGLYLNTPSSVYIANTNVNNNDLLLSGKLTIVNGNVFVGQTAAPNNDNDIEYTGSGVAAIEIQGGQLIVNGQVRRNPATSGGTLNYNQTGGTVRINGNNTNTTNAKLEIVNSGSSFNMSNGTITFVRGGGGSTYGDLFLRPGSGSVTGGTITFSQGAGLTAVQNYLIDASIPLNNMTITGTNGQNATVKIMVSPLVLNGNLILTNANSILDANSDLSIDLTINGNLTNNGTYNYYNNLTSFKGGTQTINGTSATNFYNLQVNPVTSLTLSAGNAVVYNNLDIVNGSLFCGNNTVNVKGDVTNNGSYTGTSGIAMNGTSLQYIGGLGTFGRLELNNAFGAKLRNNVTFLNGNLVLTNGVFNINQYLLTIGSNNNITTTGSFSINKMVITDGANSNYGIQKFFPIISSGTTTFTYPIGVDGKYTPAVLSITSNASVGPIRVTPVNASHPTLLDPGNALDYYWKMESGVTGFAGNMVLHYNEGDVNGSEESNYLAARLIDPGNTWTKFSGNVNAVANTASFPYPAGTDNLSGDYTAGVDAAIPNTVQVYTTISDGNWSDVNIWSPLAPAGGPNGAIVVINHIVDADVSNCNAYRTTINSKLRIIAPYSNHNLGNVDGYGTLYLETGLLPAGDFTSFLDCSSNSVLEYGGTGSYTIVADRLDNIPNMLFSGTGSRIMPNKNLTICRSLNINGPTLDNSINNRKITILGSMSLISGSFESGIGPTATVTFAGTLSQTVSNFTGSNAFNNLEIDNSLGMTLNGPVHLKNNLLLTNGIINTSSVNILTLSNSAINTVFPYGGSSLSYVEGPMVKMINQSDNFTFPVGKSNKLGNQLTLYSVRVGTLPWTVEFHSPNPTATSITAPLEASSPDDYWTVSVPGTTNQAIINIAWTESSGLTPLMTVNGVSDMTLAEYNSTNWTLLNSTATGNSSEGYAQSDNYYTFSNVPRNFTLASLSTVKPRAKLSPAAPVCGTGSGIPVSFTTFYPINLNYSLAYSFNGVPQTPVTITSLPYILPTPAIGTYQLTGFTYNGGAGSGVVDQGIITVYALPTAANAGADQTGMALCGSTGATLEANAPLIGTGLWSIVTGSGGTVVFPTNPSSTFAGTNGTSYNLRWTVTNGKCTSSDVVTIAFPISPKVPSAFTAGQSTVCQGQPDVIYTVLNDPNATSFSWSFGGTGASISGTSNSVTIDYAGNATSGILSVSTVNGCGTSAARTLPITVNARPTPGMAISEGSGTTNNDGIICPGVSTGLISSGGTNYTWSSGESTAGISKTPATTTTYTVTVTDANGCSNTRSQVITVNPLPTVSISVAETSGSVNNDGIICKGDPIVLTASGGVNYLWSGGEITAAITVAPATNTTYTVTVTDANICSNSGNRLVTVIDPPNTGDFYRKPNN